MCVYLQARTAASSSVQMASVLMKAWNVMMSIIVSTAQMNDCVVSIALMCNLGNFGNI